MRIKDKTYSFFYRFLEKTLFYKLLVFFLGVVVFFFFYFSFIFLTLPKLLTMEDYKPPLLTEVYDRNGEKVGEFFKQRRRLFKYEDMPKILIDAFVAAEDGSFFSHKGINYKAILRAVIANLKAGRKVQGGSTITQQVARSLLLSSKKTYTRKIKEAILSLRMEIVLSKQDILYIYLNQIYLGHGAYGVELASQIYFRKSTKNLTLAEVTLLAGIPKAPSRFSPIYSSERAKRRQAYVLERMFQEGYITKKQAKNTLAQKVKVYVREDFNKQAPYYLETVRRILLETILEGDILSDGFRIYTSMDFNKQKEARLVLREGLEKLDKRQGFRGVVGNISSPEEQSEFLLKEVKKLRFSLIKYHTLPSYEFMEEELNETEELNTKIELTIKQRDKKPEEDPFKLPWKDYKEDLKGILFKALISKVNQDMLFLKVPWGQATLRLDDLKWARPIDQKEENPFLEDLRDVFKPNDIVLVRLKKEAEESENEIKTTLPLELYQEPLVEGALVSFDLQTEEVLALVGGYDYKRSQFNRVYQSSRQLGSVFKPFVYGAALERGFTPATIISDNPLVFTKEEAKEEESTGKTENQNLWKPKNINNRFSGDLLFRTALIRSLNVPTIKIIKKVGLSWVNFYAHRLGIFSPLNPDYTMALGSSSASLYEISKAFSVFSIAGKEIKPLLISRVEDREGRVILANIGLDHFFEDKIKSNKEFVQEEKKKWFKGSPSKADLEGEKSDKLTDWKTLLHSESSQLIPITSSYIVTNLLKGVVYDAEGTGRHAQRLERPVGGKTGTTDGYYDTWFVGFSPQISAGVWVGFDKEKSLGKGETGSRVALPIWTKYMKVAHEDIPEKEFPIPEGVVFVNIDGDTGGLVSDSTTKVVNQAFKEGEEPKDVMIVDIETTIAESEGESKMLEEKESEETSSSDDEQFIREDLSR